MRCDENFRLINKESEIAPNSAFIVDDTIDERV